MTLIANRKSDATDISKFSYWLDAAGLRTRTDISGSAYTAASIEYSYDNAYQLTREARTGGNAFTDSFWYDPAGNRTKIDSGGTTTAYSYDYTDRMTLSGTAQYQWDYWGNVTKVGNDTYYWDDADRLTRVDHSTDNTRDTSFAYAPGSWQRIKRVKNSTAIYYAWDGDDIQAEYSSGGSANSKYLTPGLDDHLALYSGGSTYYYFQDGLGSIRNVVDSSEAIRSTYDYRAFGQGLGSYTEGVYSAFKYTGAYSDWYLAPAAYYMRNREYMPSVGAWMSRDPLLLTAGLSLYLYCMNDPVNRFDPMGLWSWTQTWGLVKMVAGMCEVVAGASLALAGGATVGGAIAGGVIGLAVMAHGLDTIQSGARQMVTGRPTEALTSEMLQAAGLSQPAAELVDAGIGIVGSMGAGVWAGGARATAVMAQPGAQGLSKLEALTRWEEGSRNLSGGAWRALGGAETNALQKAAQIQAGANAPRDWNLLPAFSRFLTPGGSGGLTPLGDYGVGAMGATSHGVAGVANAKGCAE